MGNVGKMRTITKILNGEIPISKLTNYLKVKYSYLIKSPKVYGYPTSIRIEPTNICNLNCPLCPSGELTRPKGFMKLSDFKKIIDELYPYLFTLSFWNYGEPLMKNEFYDMIKYAKDKGIHVTTSTNGHFFTSNEKVKRLINTGLDVVIVSMDGATSATYDKYRVNGDVDKVLDGLKRLVKIKKELNSKTPFIQLQFIVMKFNEYEIPFIKGLAKEIGVDELLLKTVNLNMDYAKRGSELIDDFLKKTKYLPTNEAYSRYKQEAEISNRVDINKLSCPSVYFGSVINWDGSVSPCCNDADSSINFGNCLEEGFMNIWNNDKYVNFRKMLNKNKGSIPLCKFCIPEQEKYLEKKQTNSEDEK